MKRAIIYTATLVSMLIANKALASTYFIDGKEVTKGEAIVALANNPKIVVIKQDEMKLDMDKGTLKVKSK